MKVQREGENLFILKRSIQSEKEKENVGDLGQWVSGKRRDETSKLAKF